jgi:hypothetical protein
MTDVRAAIVRDLEPVKPLCSPSVRAVALAPLAAAIVVSVPALHFLRPDIHAIGFVRAWGFSIAQAIAGLVIVAAALRDSIPGRGLSRGAVATIIAGGLAVPSVVLLLTASAFDIGPDAEAWWVVGLACFRTSAAAAVPALLMSSILAARALPLRPALTGALYGLGSGLIADAGLRLWCEFSAPQHVLLAHGGAIVASMMVGALVATLAARWQA